MAKTPRLGECSFTNISGASFDFLGQHSVQQFSPTYQGRMQERPQMQASGRHPVDSFYDALQIHQEGLLVGADPVEMLAERDAFIAAMLGDLRRTARAEKTGTLTIAYAGLATVSGAVSVESFEAPLDKEGVVTCAYMVSWVAFDPAFDDSGFTARL